MAQEKKRSVTVDVEEFVRTRDALTTAFMALSSSVDKAVKAYIDHTNAVLAGDASLKVSYLTQPFNALTAAAMDLASQSQTLASASLDATAEPDVKGKKRKRAYKPRDPHAPKRPLTAYFRYLQEMRPLLRIELKDDTKLHKPGELSQVATERWSKLSPEEKAPYHEAYQEAKKSYEQQVEDYKTMTGQLVVEEEDDDEMVEETPEIVAAAPVAEEDDDDDDDSDSDDSDTPPPPKKVAKKSVSPEAVKKTPKPTAVEKTPKTSSKKDSKPTSTSTPMFSSINIPPVAASSKKQKSDAIGEPTPKKRGRPSKADKAAAEAENEDEPRKEKVAKPKKKKVVEA